jgi:hypothetical protein
VYPIAWIDIHGCLLKHLYEYSYEYLRGYGYGHRHVHGWQWLKCTIRAGNCLQPVTFTVCCCNLFRMRRQCRVPSFLFVKNRFHRLDANLDQFASMGSPRRRNAGDVFAPDPMGESASTEKTELSSYLVPFRRSLLRSDASGGRGIR